MHPSFERHWRKLQVSRDRMLRSLQSWPAADLERKPSLDVWSAAQVIDHMSRVESGILETVRKHVAQPQTITGDDRVGALIVRCVMRSRMRVEAPASAPGIQPENGVSYEKALTDWAAARERWQAFLAMPDLPTAGGVFSHPRGGWFTLPGTLLFVRLHHDHHRPQLARLARKLRP